MKLISRLFKKTPPKIATISEQIHSLATHSNAQLIEVVVAGRDDVLREAAIAKLTYGAELLGLLNSSHSARIQVAARKRIAQLLDDKLVTSAQLAQDLPNLNERLSAVSYSTQASLELMEKVTDTNALIKIACEASTTQIRQAAAEKIVGRDQLELIAKTAQNKDKNVYKIVKTKLDVFKSTDAQRAELEVQAQNLCAKLEKHSHQEADAVFKARLPILKQEWSSLSASVSQAISDRYMKALEACEAKIHMQVHAIEKEEENIQLDQQALALAKAAVDNVKTFIADIYSVAHIDDLIANNYEHKLEELTHAIRLAANQSVPMVKLVKEFEHRKQQALQLIGSVKNSGTVMQLTLQLQDLQLQSLENTDAAQAVKNKLKQLLKMAQELSHEQRSIAVMNAEAALQAWDVKRDAIEQTAKNALREVSELTRKGLWSAEQGFVRKARAIQKELNEKCEKIADLPKAVRAKLEEFELNISKLGDWHEFAVTPKKEALIVHMQSLIESKISPEDLATKIHELQDEWKEVSKGGQQPDETLWNQFHQASEQAFAPCKEFFDAQAAAREQNLKKRQEMVDQLQHYLASYQWQSADWAGVEKTLKVARQEWQHYWPVPRKSGNELQQTFEALMEQLFAKITTEYENNKSAKQQLIEKAQALLSSTDTRAAIESVKKMQASWKSIGKSGYKEDQHLWQEFRQHCDTIFGRRNQEVETANLQRNAIQQQADAGITKLESILALSLVELMAAKADIEVTKTDFFALELPRDTAKVLTEKCNTLLSAIAQKIELERNKAEIQSWQDMFNVCNAIRDFEVAVITGKTGDEMRVQQESIAALIANTSRWPTGSLSIVQQRFAKAENLVKDDQAKNAQSLRLIAIRAEILTGIDTPATDKLMRMNYQVQQMQQAFGNRDTRLNDLVMEWISVGGVSAEVYQELLNRFNACRQAGVKK
jgi:DNA repair protein SbcC/Rad50